MLFNKALRSYKRLADIFNPIVMEGAGSISEINLWEKDITNMRIALATNAVTYLIADIDKGGVFGSVYGTIQLLPPEERKLIKGIIINKFRGDISLFLSGKKMLEKLVGIPVVSIIPYYRDIFIDDEDSVIIDKKRTSGISNKINIVVVLLNHMSNFTDFNVLERIPEVHLFYTHSIDEILAADIVIIPGSKNTIEDLLYLRKTGLAKAIITAHHSGTSVYGICGGFQMMGLEINDPYHVEGEIEIASGLGILPVSTTLTKEKVTEQCLFTFLHNEAQCKGYEIHMGETRAADHSPVCRTVNGKDDGYYLNSQTWGTYIHGIFDNISIIKNIIETAGGKSSAVFNADDFKNDQYNKLAELVRENTEMEYIYKTLQF